MKICELTIISFLSYALYLFQELGKGAFDIYAKLMFGIGVTFVIFGCCIKKTKMTQYFGCKHKWAYLSDENWEKYNLWGGNNLILAGAIVLIGTILQNKYFLVGGIVTLLLGMFFMIKYAENLLKQIQNEEVNAKKEQ